VSATTTSDGHIRFGVRDTGIGLTAERIVQLYQPFNRLGQEAGPEQGTGIGLVVTKRVVEAMNGTIKVESEVGVGTVFWIDLMATNRSGVPVYAIQSSGV
jgi:signal transduction histidine kinase